MNKIVARLCLISFQRYCFDMLLGLFDNLANSLPELRASHPLDIVG